MAKKPEKIIISIREELDTYSSIDIAEIAEKIQRLSRCTHRIRLLLRNLRYVWQS